MKTISRIKICLARQIQIFGILLEVLDNGVTELGFNVPPTYSERKPWFNPIALRKAKIVRNFGLSECNGVKVSSKIPDAQGIKPLIGQREVDYERLRLCNGALFRCGQNWTCSMIQSCEH